jgi:hypothetical protein
VRAGLASGFDEVRTKWSFADLSDAIDWLEWAQRGDDEEAGGKES